MELGLTLGKTGMSLQAKKRFQLAVEGNPRDARAWFWLGLFQSDQGKHTEVRTSPNRFLELAPSRYDRQITQARPRLAALP